MLQNIENLYFGGNPDGKYKAKDKEVAKFNRVAKIQKLYPEIDAKLRKFCEVDGITERKTYAFSVLMMIECGIRIGNEDSAEGRISKAKKTEGQVLKTYGLTTLLHEHVSFDGSSMILDFIGKKSVAQHMIISDPFLVKVGFEFFRQERPRWLTINGKEFTKENVNKFIKKSIGNGFSAKDFRAFRANIEAAKSSLIILQTKIKDPKKSFVNNEIKQICTEVSQILGNSPGISRKSYINPQVLHRHWNNRGFKVEFITKKGKKKETILKKG